MKCYLDKVLRLLLSIQVIAAICFVAPGHAHEDHEEHGDCPICFMVSLPAEECVVFTFDIRQVYSDSHLQLEVHFQCYDSPQFFYPRAPPHFLIA
jgi:hypothetical protein